MKRYMIKNYKGLELWDEKQKELCKKSLKLWYYSNQATIKSVSFTKQIIFQLIRNNLKIGAFTTILKKIPTKFDINSQSQSYQKIIHKEFIPIFLRFSINETVNEVTQEDIKYGINYWKRPTIEDQCIIGRNLNYWYGGINIYPRPEYSTKLVNVYNDIEAIPGDNLEFYTAYKEYIFKGDMDVKFYKVKDTSIDTDNDSNQFLVITKEPYESKAIEKTSLFGSKKKATKLQVLKEYTKEEPVEIIKELIKTSVEEDPSDELINTYYYKYLILYKLNLIETCILFENKKENDLFFFDESQKNNIEYDLQDENYFFNYNFIIYKNNLCKKPELFNKIIKKSLDYYNKLRDEHKAYVKQEKKASNPETVNKHNLDIWEGEEVFNAGGALKTVKRKRKIKVKSRAKPKLAVNSKIKIKAKAKGKAKRNARSSVKRKKSKF
jgi:hypothetical protein